MADARTPLHVTPITDDVEVARDWLARFEGGGIDGVVAKQLAGSGTHPAEVLR